MVNVEYEPAGRAWCPWWCRVSEDVGAKPKSDPNRRPSPRVPHPADGNLAVRTKYMVKTSYPSNATSADEFKL